MDLYDIPETVKARFGERGQQAYVEQYTRVVASAGPVRAHELAWTSAQRWDESEVARDFTTKQRKAAAGKGQALGDGSFPIKNREDLKNAIGLAGKAKDPAKARAHIKKRARALGLTDMIPDSWTEKAHAAGGFSAQDIERGLRELLRERFGGKDIYVGVMDWGDDWVAYTVENMTDGGSWDSFRLPFKVEDEGPTLGEGDPVKVAPRTSFVPVKEAAGQRERAFVVRTPQRTFITGLAHVTELAALKGLANPGFQYLSGLYVGGEKANRNNAFWSTEDLVLGEPTVAYGPLNWLHDDHMIVGALAEARLVRPTLVEAAQAVAEPHIAAAGVVWQFLHPQQAQIIETSAAAGQAYFSMECVSKTVACVDHGCGEWPYGDYRQGKGCEHVNTRTGAAQFKEPIFLGGGIIVPPVKPGWADAHLTVMKEAASYAERTFEQAGRPDIPATDWERIVAQVLSQAG